MNKRTFLFTSEQVSDGHPDKMCDIVSDSILDALLSVDPSAKLACETLVKNNTVVLAGEVNTTAKIDYEKTVREALSEIGYNDEKVDFNPETCQIVNLLDIQSDEIAESVHLKKSIEEIGAGDQGLMMGYATNETEEMLPLTLVLSTNLIKKIREYRKSGEYMWIRPDCKTQVTVEYEEIDNGKIKPLRVHTVLISLQHTKDCTTDFIRDFIKEHVIKKVIPASFLDDKTIYYINPSNSFVVGGPKGDAGVTGRKIIADTYGGWGGHGGGAFSGKDATKVDRSAAYAARWMAKSLVANDYCERCLVQVTYGIGLAKPISLYVESYGTVKHGLKDNDLTEKLRLNFDLRPGMIIKELDLEKPIYKETCILNHFMPKKSSTWEKPKTI